MGAYINPEGRTKENWLDENAKPITDVEARSHKDFENNFVVALLHNSSFTAACIAFSEEELKVVTDPRDMRLIIYFVAAKEDLLKVSTLNSYLNPGEE
jgi:hypothetical protein